MSFKTKNLKKNYRKFAKQSLKNEIKFSAKCKHYDVIRRVFKIIKLYNFKKILIFMPTKTEPNLLLFRKIFKKKCEILIPFMVGISFKMVKLRSPFFISKFGIKESQNQNEFKKNIDLAVVPVIGVDGNFARIGHGKGYYDKFFCNLKYRPCVIFVEIKDLFTKNRISQSHDLIGDFYLTPTKNYLNRGKYDRDFYRIRSRCGGSWCRLSCGQKNK